MKRKWIAAVLAACFTLGLMLSGCTPSGKDAEGEAAVQSVAMLAGLGSTGLYDSYAGLVVSQNEVKIEKDANKTVLELLIAEDQDVKMGDVLFTYDTEEIQYNIDKATLELEQMNNSLASKKEQKTRLEAEKAKASASEQLSYTIEIQALEADILEQQYNISLKGEDLARLKESLNNAEVTSPIDGRILSVSENGYDNYGNPLPYITILQVGDYRVKGTINEQNAQDLMQGTAVVVRSRVDETQTWTGIVSMIDWENPETSNNNNMYYYASSNEMTTSSKYPFYVELTDPAGLMLGQHVYIEPDLGQNERDDTIRLPAYLLNDIADGSAWVWAANKKDKLEKRNVTLGAYDEAGDTWEIVSGLTADDYIAYPDETLKEGMTVTKYDDGYFDNGSGEGMEGGLPDGGIVEGGGEVYEDGGEVYEDGGEIYEEGDTGEAVIVPKVAASGSDVAGVTVG